MKKTVLLFAVILAAVSSFAQKKTFVMADYADEIGTTYVNEAATTYGEDDDAITLVPGTPGSDGWKINTTNTNVKVLLFGKANTAIQLPAFDFAVAKIVVNGPASGASGKVTFNVFDGETAVSTQVTGANGTHEFQIAADHQAAGTVYSIKNTNANNNQIVSIEVYEAVANAPAAPTFSVKGGTFTTSQTVSLACTTEGADIYYTLDGTDPTAESTKYTAPITISTTTTVTAVAIKNNVLSTVEAETYTIISTTGQGTKDDPYTVADVALLNNCGKTAWVIGNVYGVFANNAATATVGSTASNIALSQDESFIPVMLPAGDVRDALNLVKHPELQGGMVKVYGDLVSYFSTTGVKNVTDYEIIYTTGISEVEAKTANGKFLENGRIVIMKNGKKFNVAGQKL